MRIASPLRLPVRTARSRRSQRGQILVMFVIALVAMLWMLRLLVDMASALTLRRSMQDSSDAAALAGANVLDDRGCAALIAAVRAAANNSLAANNWGPDRASAEILCAPDWQNMGVTVRVTAANPGYFFDPVPLTVDSTAVNGTRLEGAASVLTLHHDRCNAFYLNGSVSLTFDGSVHVNSDANPGAGSCNNSEAAALGKGGASIVKLQGDARMRIRGSAKNINITPAPEHGDLLADPFASIDEPADRPDLFPLQTNPPTHTVKETQCADPPCKNVAIIVSPGHYTKQKDFPKISAGNFLVFLPGVYIFDNVILDNQGGTFCTLPERDPDAKGSGAWTYESVTAACASSTPWSQMCASLDAQRNGATRCGALITFDGFTSCSAKNPPEILAGGGSGTILLRQYLSGAAEGEDLEKYDGFLLWFSRAHAQDPGCNASLHGGGGSEFSGVIYGPTTNLSMAGGGTGSAGALTLQMVVSTVEYKGGSVFNFHYDANELSRHAVYGLVE